MAVATKPVANDARANEFLASPRKMLINGQWVESASGKTFATYNPADGEELVQVAEGDKEDIDRAVKAARKAFEEGPWSKTTPNVRSKMLWKLSELIANTCKLSPNSKRSTTARPSPSPQQSTSRPPSSSSSTCPVGPRRSTDAPSPSPARHIGPSPAANLSASAARSSHGTSRSSWPRGNSRPRSPAATPSCSSPRSKPLSPRSSSANSFEEAGFPPGVVNIVPGFGETAGAALSEPSLVDKVAFTGSTEVGKIIMRAASGNLKKVSLELGGKAPNIVFDDADLNAATAGAAMGIFFNQGQVCCAGSRLYVEKKSFDTVVGALSDAAKNMKIAAGMDPACEMGPLVSEEQHQRVTRMVKGGLQAGAKALVGGGPVEGPGYFYKPTVLTNVDHNMEVVREEIFGPVVVASPFDDVDDLAKKANDTPYGLSAGVWTNNLKKAHQMAAKLKAGTVWINCYNVFDPHMPFGGYKQSGIGREMGPEVLDLYTQVKSVCIGF